jgi:O-antigen ligase
MSASGSAWSRATAAFLAAALFVIPFTSSIALRNGFLALAAATLLVSAAKSDRPRPRLPPWRVLAPMLAWGGWCIASVAWSVEPAYSLSELRPELLYPFIAFLLFFAATPDARALDRWAWAVAAGLAALAIAAIGQAALDGAWDPKRWHADTGSFATHVVLAQPLVAWAFLRAAPGARLARAALAATALLTFLVMAWNDNRIAWVALAGMVLVASALAAPEIAPARRARFALAVLVALAALAALFSLSLHSRTEKLESTEREAEADLLRDPRLAIWRFTARRVAESPWVGYGFGRGIQRQEIRTGSVPGVDNPLYLHGHNTVLNVALQGGLVGLALFAWMVGALVREMARGLREAPPRRHAAMLGLVLVAGFAIRNMTDDFLVRHNALLAWSLAGAVLGALRPTSARTPG